MVTADDEERWDAKKRDILNMFGNVVKTGSLNGKVELQASLIALDQVLAMAPIGGPVDLTAFDDFLQERTPDKGAINEAMVFFEHRGSRQQVMLMLHPRLQDMTAAEKEGVLSDWSGASQQAVVYSAQGAEPLPGTKAPRAKTKTFSKKKKRAGPNPAYLVLLVLVIASGVGAYLYNEQSGAPQVNHTIVLPEDSAALTCIRTLAVGSKLTCKVADAQWKKYSASDRSVRIEETKKLAADKGFSTLRVSVAETGQFIGSY